MRNSAEATTENVTQNATQHPTQNATQSGVLGLLERFGGGSALISRGASVKSGPSSDPPSTTDNDSASHAATGIQQAHEDCSDAEWGFDTPSPQKSTLVSPSPEQSKLATPSDSAAEAQDPSALPPPLSSLLESGPAENPTKFGFQEGITSSDSVTSPPLSPLDGRDPQSSVEFGFGSDGSENPTPISPVINEFSLAPPAIDVQDTDAATSSAVTPALNGGLCQQSPCNEFVVFDCV